MKVVIAFKIHRKGVELLKEYGFTVSMYEQGRVPDYDWLCKELSEADILVVTPIHRVDNQVLGCSPKLKLIMLFGSGYENIDLEACKARDICVARVASPIAKATAEHTLALTLAVLRKIVKAHNYVKSKQWSSGPAPRELLASSLWGKTIGIIGMGRVGSYLVKLLKAFDTRVIYWSRSRKLELEHALGIEYVRDLDELLSQADIVIVSVPLTKETYHLINEEKLKKMKRSAILINTARGAVVDTEALVKALREGWIAGAGLDVFEQEPLPREHPLYELENVVLTPHIGGYTIEAVIETSVEIAKEIANFILRNIYPRDPLTPETCYRRCIS